MLQNKALWNLKIDKSAFSKNKFDVCLNSIESNFQKSFIFLNTTNFEFRKINLNHNIFKQLKNFFVFIL